MPEGESVEVTNPLLGTLKLAGSNVNTIATVCTLILVCIIAYVLSAHAGDAKDGAKSVAAELKEANKEVASTLKESNKDIAKVLSELAQAMREANCLAQFTTPTEKAANADLCKRLSR